MVVGRPFPAFEAAPVAPAKHPLFLLSCFFMAHTEL